MKIFPIITREMVINLVESKYQGNTKRERMRKLFEYKYGVPFSPRGLGKLPQGQMTNIYKDINKIR